MPEGGAIVTFAATLIVLASLGEFAAIPFVLKGELPLYAVPPVVRALLAALMGSSAGGGVATFYAAITGESIVVPIAVFLGGQTLTAWVVLAYVVYHTVKNGR